jgi:hypothetical protein
MIKICCKIFKPALKDYLLLRYFAFGTFSTKHMHIIKYLLTQIPCCILICIMLMIFLQLYKKHVSYYIVLYCCIFHSFIHSFLYFSVYLYTSKTMDVEIVKNIEYNIVNHTMLSH